MASLEPTLISDMTNEKLERRTLDAIQREFGLGGVAQFIMTYRSGHGDYTADRHQWLDGIPLEEVAAEMK